jgi:hypothetical protein
VALETVLLVMLPALYFSRLGTDEIGEGAIVEVFVEKVGVPGVVLVSV